MGDRLAGKVVLITGTAGGQGRAAALLFASEGAVVVGCDVKEAEARETVALVEAAGGQMTSSEPVDLGDSAAARDEVRPGGAAGVEHQVELVADREVPLFIGHRGDRREAWR